MQKISSCLWFDSQAEEAARFYVSIFKNSKMGAITHYDKGVAEVAQRPVGSVMTVTFTLDGEEFMGLNGGPQFKFSEAISLMVHCDTQRELDDYWAKLSAGGQIQQCGWLKDRYGLSWQIVPSSLEKLLTSDVAKRTRVMQALLQMTKLDIATLEKA
jgi:predicted 3-demethylubiquinone-9 3-methyltransferase (glyoxalase superfamily)